jgi:hypothetical protein
MKDRGDRWNRSIDSLSMGSSWPDGRRGLSLVLLALSACTGAGSGENVTAATCSAGDPQAELEMEIVCRDEGAAVLPVDEDARLPLMPAPQGGHIVLIGVRTNNLEGCNLKLSGALVDVETRAVVSLERRPVTMAVASDGWLEAKHPEAASSYLNIAACPHASLSRPINDQTYELQVTVTDQKNRTIQASTTVVPTCSSDSCQCECAKDYKLGGGCGSDDGAGGAGNPGGAGNAGDAGAGGMN